MSRVQLDVRDAAELAEMLTSISDWRAGPDSARLTESFQRFMGIDANDLADLRVDIARFTFLLGRDDEGRFFREA
jgi:hypothetical protein